MTATNADKSAGLTKKQLRIIVLRRLRKQTEQQREYKSVLIGQQLFKQEEFIKAKRIMFYRDFDGEVKTEKMIHKARQLGKEIYMPVCDKEEHALKPCFFKTDSAWQCGPYKTWEPKEKMYIASDRIDLVVVPGLAFDAHGNRLGRGKGYYDRFLKSIPSHISSIGLAFNFQIFPALSVGNNDHPVKKVLSA